MADFDTFLDDIKGEFVAMVDANWHEFKGAAMEDAADFLDKSKADLERWTRLLAEGSLTKDDFEWLVESKKDLVLMEALKQSGLMKVRRDRFRNAVFGMLVDKALKLFA